MPYGPEHGVISKRGWLGGTKKVNDYWGREMYARTAFSWLLCSLAVIATPCFGQTAPSENLQNLFQRLLTNPSDIALNRQYARLEIEQNRLRNALAAYERILAADPTNEEAKEGIERIRRLLEPQFTTLDVVVGGQYETNPRLAGQGRQSGDDFSATTQADLTDERQVGDVRLYSEGHLFADFYTRFSDINYGKISGDTGPVLGLGSDWNVHPSLGAGFAWLHGDPFYKEASTGLRFIPTNGLPLRRVDFRFAYDNIDRAISQRDAYVVDITPQFYWTRLAINEDAFFVTPFYRFNGVLGSGPAGVGQFGQPFPLESQQFGGRVDYYVTLHEALAFDVNFTGYYEPFTSTVTNGIARRNDRYLSPGVQLIWKEVGLKRLDIVFSYQFEDNHSNDVTETFTNHVVAIRSLWHF